jgi:23S rRNA pseudouridine1911/1915/1917 synthase
VSPLYRFTVDDRLAGARLDRCVADLHGEWSRSRVRRLIDDGHVLLNDEPAKPATQVAAGDRIEVDEPAPQKLDLVAEDIPLVILHEDDELLVLDKPPGLVIHPAAGNRSGTLVNALLRHCGELSVIGGVERPGIVHRLDKDTSGLMVVAKTERAHLALSIAFRRREIEKRYLAACFGLPAAGSGVIEGAVGRHPTERKQMAVVASGRQARTLYRVVERFAGTCLVECRPITGRTHQIRVHMAHLGHAVVGDPVYSGRQWRGLEDPRHRAACRDFPRQALHAWRLAFNHPLSGERSEFEAAPPADFRELLALLRS